MCTLETLRIFLDNNAKEIREVLAKHGFYIDVIALAKLNITEPVIKKMEDIKEEIE